VHHEIALISAIVSKRGTPSMCQIIQIRVIDPDILGVLWYWAASHFGGAGVRCYDLPTVVKLL
jgi:hypothetical protein